MPYGKKNSSSREDKRQKFIKGAKKYLAPDDTASKPTRLGRIARMKRTARELVGGKSTYLRKKKKSRVKTLPGSPKDMLEKNLTQKEIGRLKKKG